MDDIEASTRLLSPQAHCFGAYDCLSWTSNKSVEYGLELSTTLIIDNKIM